MLAVDLGGTHMRVAIFSPGGKIVHQTRTATPSRDPDALPWAMRAAIDEAGLPVQGAVVGVPGVAVTSRDVELAERFGAELPTARGIPEEFIDAP